MSYYVYNLLGTNTELKFEYKGKVRNMIDYKDLFNY
jgi:hypothetical protein